MNTELLIEKLNKGEIIYIKDNYEEVVLKIEPTADNILTFAKFKGKKEYNINPAAKLVFEAKLGGVEITKEEYENY